MMLEPRFRNWPTLEHKPNQRSPLTEAEWLVEVEARHTIIAQRCVRLAEGMGSVSQQSYGIRISSILITSPYAE